MNVTTFQQHLHTAFIHGPWANEEILGFVLPLFEEVLSFHEAGQVGSFDIPDTVFLTNGRLDIDEQHTHAPLLNEPAIQKLLQQERINGFTITEKWQIEESVGKGAAIANLEVQADPRAALIRPVYLPGYQCYELMLGHHDAQTDIFCLGLILGSVVMGLDLYKEEELQQFARYRKQSAGLNNRVHATICALVTEMTDLDRAKRSQDLPDVIQRLKYYRDYEPERQIDLSHMAILEVEKPADRNAFILNKLRDRLFDKSRRNRLLYYKPNSRFVNLTVSSVPMVLHYQSIRPESLFTWNEEIAGQIVGMKDLSLNKYLRFEDHPYLNAQLNGVRQSADSDEKEYGFSQLRLVVAFLHWHNLKESPNERIQSPLLLLPVQLKRSKSLKEEKFVLEITDNAAMINPVLANHLEELYGIRLPESIDFDDVTMEAFFKALKSKIDEAKQGVLLHYIDKPRIRLVHNIARQTIHNYKKRLKQKTGGAFHQVDYSYSEDNYKPLGLELYRQKIEPKQSGLEFLLEGHQPANGADLLADTAGTQQRTTIQLTDGESNPYSWDFDICNMVLGNFHYKKMSLVSDYNAVADQGIQHEVFNELFSNQPRREREAPQAQGPEQWYHVIAADPTQAKAILHSRTGNSYIIQGPPGTGKSQTITNLVADFLAQGKTVLFICEKRTALDVVYHRLQQNGLSELCCYIHDSQGDKKEFIKDLKNVYESFLHNKMDLDSITGQRQTALASLAEQLKVLQAYHTQQRKVHPEAGITTRKLIETLIQLRPQVPVLNSGYKEQLPSYHTWLQFGQVMHQLSKALEETGATPQLANHAFSNLGNAVMQAENPFTIMESLSGHAFVVIDQMATIVAQNNIPAQHAEKLENIINLVHDSIMLEPLAQSGSLQLVNKINPEAQVFEEVYRQYRQLQQQYQEALENTGHWQQRFSRQEVAQALEIASKYEKAFFRFLNGNWRRLKKQLKKAYDFSGHQLPPAYSKILEQLQEEYQAEDKLRRQQTTLQKQYGTDDIDAVYAGIDLLRHKQGDAEIDYLLSHPRANELVLQLSKLNNTLHQLELQLQQCLYHYELKSLREIKDELATINANADVLKDLLPALRQFATMPADLQHIIRQVPLTPQQAEAAMAHKTMQLLLEKEPQFAQTRYYSLQKAVTAIESTYNELLGLNSDYIRAARRKAFLERYQLSNASGVDLSDEDKQLKKDYTEGRRILEHEMGKSMRYKSIRTMASDESGKVLRDIKPVWLMSPLSVSDSLPLDIHFFDVVIFDEASQITLEEGIPALFRAPQAIIVGDDKQMPPSNFFNTRAEDPNDLDTFEGETEDEILSSDADSLLVQGARKLCNTMLRWHYRSRYETLISYSNHAFYEADLLTIPDKTIIHHNKPGIEIMQPEEGLQTAQHLLNSSISFHYLPNSVYQDRGNSNEASYIAYMLKQLLQSQVEESIGIVAFSQEQQAVIEEAIEALAAADKTFEELLEKAYNRKDEGQVTGLFIKNLESVQGDERDIIIMSVCYGYDSRKKMLMNFGPINRKGGEKRLNVIFSRAKKHMAIVSSIKHHDIRNDYNAGANYFKRFLHYAEMISTGNTTQARTILDSLMTGEKWQRAKTDTTPSATAMQLKKALEAKGYMVGVEIGQSSFKCSLAVKKQAADSFYSVGILLDDELHYQNSDVIEQYYQRPAILQAFGWKMVHVYAKDWLEDKEGVLQMLVRAIQEDNMAGAASAVTDPQKLPVQEANAETDAALVTVTALVSPERGLFWAIDRSGSQLTQRFGRTGTKGQLQVKTYATEEEAVVAQEALIQEHLGAGFKPLAQ